MDRRNLRGDALGSDYGQTPSGLVVYAGAAHSPVWRGLRFNPSARPSSPHTNVVPIYWELTWSSGCYPGESWVTLAW